MASHPIPRRVQTGLHCTLALVLLVFVAACSDDAPESSNDAGSDASSDALQGDAPDDTREEPAQGYCRESSDCGPGGRCSFGYCDRVAPQESSAECNSAFYEPPGDACAINPVTGEVTTLDNAECDDDADCADSPFGPRCLYSACTVLEPCDDSGECPAPEQYCHDYNVCIESSIE